MKRQCDRTLRLAQTFAQHKVHDQLTVSFMEPAGATCVCTTGLTGELCGLSSTMLHKHTC